MTWIEKAQPTPLDDKPIEGLWFLDGDQLARRLAQDWTRGQKYPLIVFPSKLECDIWPAGNPEAIAIVHLFGEMDLPLGVDRDTAFESANAIAEQAGYIARRIGEDTLEVWGHGYHEHLKIVFDNEARRMVNIIAITERQPPPRPPLLDDETRQTLPPLYANEEVGLEASALVKFFTPDSNWTWYASEGSTMDANRYSNAPEGEQDFLMFGLVIGFEIEPGYFSLKELEAVRGPLGLPIERDRYFKPASLRALREQHWKERGE